MSDAPHNSDNTPASAGAETTTNPNPTAPAAPEMPTTKEGLLAAMDAAHEADLRAARGEPDVTPDDPNNEPEIDDAPDAGIESGEGDEVPPADDPATEVEGRYDHLDAGERRVLDLVSKHGLTLAEAQRAVFGAEPNRQQDAAPQEDPVAKADQSIATLQGEIDALEAEADEAFAPEDRRRINKELRQKTVELAEVQADRRWLKRQSEQDTLTREQQAVERTQNAMNAAAMEAEAAYPELSNPNSTLSQAVAEEIDYLTAAGSPLMKDPRYPLLVARRIARNLGVRPPASTTTPTPGLQPTPPTPPRRQARPVPDNGGQVAPAEKTHEQRLAEANTAEELLEYMKEYGTPISELLRKA